MHVAEHGPRDAATVVLVHAADVAGWMWDPVVEALKGDFHVLVPDLPEHGASSDDERFTIAGAADRLAAIVSERSATGSAHFAGLSRGGQVVLETLARHPEVVDTAVVCSAPVHPAPNMRLAAALAPVLYKARSFVPSGLKRFGFPEEHVPRVLEQVRQTTPDAFARCVRQTDGYRLPEALTSVGHRVLVLVGDQEIPVFATSAAEIASKLPNGRLASVRASNHYWPLSAPALFAETMRAWIADAPLPEAVAAIGAAAGG